MKRRARRNPYSRELVSFHRWLKGAPYVEDFCDHVGDWFASLDRKPPRSFDPAEPCTWLEHTSPRMRREFRGWLVDDLIGRLVGEEARDRDLGWLPDYVYFERGAEILPPTTWLVHFSDAAGKIARDGFRVGAMGSAAYTHGDASVSGPGWNFAYEADRADPSHCYGTDAVLFRSAGIRVFHKGDEETQVLFWGPHVREGEFDDVVRWVIDHHRQYRKAIVRDV